MPKIPLLLAAFLTLPLPFAHTDTLPEGKPAPPFTVKTLDGKAIRLADLKGKIVLLDFGAVNCPPCRIEMPALQKFHKQYAGQGLVVLGLLEMNPTPKAAREMVKERGLTYPMAIDAGEKIGKRYGLQAHPTTILLDKAGNVVKTEVGYLKGDEKAMEKAFLPLLHNAKAARL